jgi:tubulin polyglutamylase TTLL6/13
MLDADCKPVLLEVNHAPSFGTDSPLDYKIKSQLIFDTIRLLGMSVNRRNFYKQMMQEEQERRILSGKATRPTAEQKDRLKKEFQMKRDQFERRNLGNYDLIYPTQNEEEMAEYQKMLEVSREIWESQQSLVRVKRNNKDAPINQKKPGFFVGTVINKNKSIIKNLPFPGSSAQV